MQVQRTYRDELEDSNIAVTQLPLRERERANDWQSLERSSYVMQNLWSSRSIVTRTSTLVPRCLPHQMPTRSFSSAAPSRPKRWKWSGLLLFLPGLAAFGLGNWQIMRRKWKEELLEHRRNRLRDDVIPINLAIASVYVGSTKENKDEVPKDVMQSLEYKRVQCQGVFAEDKSIFLGPRGRTNHGVTERGYFLITPLLPVEEGNDANLQVPVLVNRGWVPGSWRDQPPHRTLESSNGGHESATEQEKARQGILSRLFHRSEETLKASEPRVTLIEVVGVIRSSERPNMFVPPNEPASGQWFFVDVPAMARAVGLPENALYVEAVRDKATEFKGKEYPDPKDPEALIRSSVMPYDHLSYAFTWYTLSAATTFMAWKRLSK